MSASAASSWLIVAFLSTTLISNKACRLLTSIITFIVFLTKAASKVILPAYVCPANSSGAKKSILIPFLSPGFNVNDGSLIISKLSTLSTLLLKLNSTFPVFSIVIISPAVSSVNKATFNTSLSMLKLGFGINVVAGAPPPAEDPAAPAAEDGFGDSSATGVSSLE